MAIDRSGNVFVADEGNNRIQKFTNTGTFIRTWGTGGSGNGQFKQPLGIGLDPSGNVFVTDTSNNRIQELQTRGFLLEHGALCIRMVWL